MITIEQIENAISKGAKRESKLNGIKESLEVPALTSLNIRHLLNNLGEIGSKYLEVGVHRGGTFCSTVFHNMLISAIAVDCWESDVTNEVKAEQDFIANANTFTEAGTKLKVIKSDAFDVDLNNIPRFIDLYLYDGGHSENDQKKALTYYFPVFDDEFIFLVDDYDWAEVQKGTQDGIKECGLKILFQTYFKGNDHDNEGWWNGFYISLLKKEA